MVYSAYSDYLECTYGNFINEAKADLKVFSGKTIYISGASGLIGSGCVDFFFCLNDKLLERPCRIILQSRSSDTLRQRFGSQIEREYAIATISSLAEISIDLFSPDYVIHAASPASPKNYISNPIDTIEANVYATYRLLKELYKNNKGNFLFISSGDVYGDPQSGQIPTPETYHGNVDLSSPRSCYAQSKRLGETVVSECYRREKLDAKIVRPFNIYGPGQRIDDGRMVADFIKSGLQKNPITMHSDGSPLRSFCYISDAVEGLIRCVIFGKAGIPYNIGNDIEEKSVRELAELASVSLELPPPSFVAPPEYQGGSLSRCCPDIDLARKELFFEPKIYFKEGVQRTWEWIQKKEMLIH